jgi:large subunit ribosomal protein L17
MRIRKLNRRLDHRQSLLKNLATSVVLYERVQTTTARAKEVRGLVERLINLGKDGSLSASRRLRGYFFDDNAAKKIIEELGPRYRGVSGGYVSVTALPSRRSDGAPMAIIELRGTTQEEAPQKSKPSAKSSDRPAPTATRKSKGKKKALKKTRQTVKRKSR